MEESSLSRQMNFSRICTSAHTDVEINEMTTFISTDTESKQRCLYLISMLHSLSLSRRPGFSTLSTVLSSFEPGSHGFYFVRQQRNAHNILDRYD